MKLKFLSLLFILIFFWSCSKEKTGHSDNILVARVGPEEISRNDLEASFIIEPQYVVRTPLNQARLSQLNFLIARKYNYLAAHRLEMENDPDLQYKINFIKKQEILKAYLQHKFINQIEISTADVAEGIQRTGKQIFVHNIFCSTRNEIEKVKQQLQVTENTNKFFQQRGVSLGWITFGTLDPSIENSIYHLNAGQISDIVQSNFGYHILKVDTIKMNMNFQIVSQALKIQQVTDIIRKRKAQTEIHQYLVQLANDQKLQVANKSLELLARSIKKNSTSWDQDPLTLIPPMQNKDLIDIRLKLENMLDEPLLKFGDERMTIGNFIERLKEMPPYHRPYLNGRKRLIQSLIDMVRNDLIFKQAVAEGYGNDKYVQEAYAKYIKELLAREFNQRCNDQNFRQTNPREWNRYQKVLIYVRQECPPSIYKQNLFSAIQNPDTIMTTPPVPVFISNQYIW